MDEFIKKNLTIIVTAFFIIIIILLVSVVFLFIGQKKIAYVDNTVVLANYKKTAFVKNEIQLKVNEYQTVT